MFKKEEVVKALEEEKADQRATEEAIKKKAFDQNKEKVVADIFKFGMGFRCSTLFMIRKKYPELDLFDMDLTLMEGYDKPNPVNRLDPKKGQGAQEIILKEIVTGQPREEENLVGEGNK